jgi:hypothetical protein
MSTPPGEASRKKKSPRKEKKNPKEGKARTAGVGMETAFLV